MEINFVDAGTSDFDPEVYLRLLVAVCKADPHNGPPEYQYVARMAARLGKDIVPLWNDTPKRFLLDGRPSVSRRTAMLVVKDAIMLATLDGNFSLGEKERVYNYAECLDLPRTDVDGIQAWLSDYSRLRDRWNRLVDAV